MISIICDHDFQCLEAFHIHIFCKLKLGPLKIISLAETKKS